MNGNTFDYNMKGKGSDGKPASSTNAYPAESDAERNNTADLASKNGTSSNAKEYNPRDSSASSNFQTGKGSKTNYGKQSWKGQTTGYSNGKGSQQGKASHDKGAYGRHSSSSSN